MRMRLKETTLNGGLLGRGILNSPRSTTQIVPHSNTQQSTKTHYLGADGNMSFTESELDFSQNAPRGYAGKHY
jgi:hypothetical protein